MKTRYENNKPINFFFKKFISLFIIFSLFLLSSNSFLDLFIKSIPKAEAATTSVQKIRVQSAYASKEYNNTTSSALMAIDGNLGTAWSAGALAAQWIELDLGAAYSVSQVNLTVNQSPNGNTTHTITAGTYPAPGTVVSTLSGSTINAQQLVANFAAVSAQYIRISTSVSPSWVGWFEIEVYGTLTVANGLVGYYSMNDFDAFIEDTSNYGTTGKYKSWPSGNTGYPSNLWGEKYYLSKSFDGSTIYGEIQPSPAESVIGLGIPFTVEAWIKPASIAAGAKAIVTNEGQWWLYQSGQNIYTGFVSASGNKNFTTTANPIATANTWYHVASVWDGTTLSVYVNGTLIQSQNFSGFSPLPSGKNIFIAQNGGGGAFYGGGIDEIKIFTTARSVSEVTSDMGAGTNSSTPGTGAQWRNNSNSGSDTTWGSGTNEANNKMVTTPLTSPTVVWNKSGGQYKSPVIANNGNVYVLQGDAMYGYDPAGNTLWGVWLPSMFAPFLTSGCATANALGNFSGNYQIAGIASNGDIIVYTISNESFTYGIAFMRFKPSANGLPTYVAYNDNFAKSDCSQWNGTVNVYQYYGIHPSGDYVYWGRYLLAGGPAVMQLTGGIRQPNIGSSRVNSSDPLNNVVNNQVHSSDGWYIYGSNNGTMYGNYLGDLSGPASNPCPGPLNKMQWWTTTNASVSQASAMVVNLPSLNKDIIIYAHGGTASGGAVVETGCRQSLEHENSLANESIMMGADRTRDRFFSVANVRGLVGAGQPYISSHTISNIPTTYTNPGNTQVQTANTFGTQYIDGVVAGGYIYVQSTNKANGETRLEAYGVTTLGTRTFLSAGYGYGNCGASNAFVSFTGCTGGLAVANDGSVYMSTGSNLIKFSPWVGTPPTATITANGSSNSYSASINSPVTISANIRDVDGDLGGANGAGQIYITPYGTQNFTLLKQVSSTDCTSGANTLSNCTFTFRWTPAEDDVGKQYTFVVNAYDTVTNQCSGNPAISTATSGGPGVWQRCDKSGLNKDLVNITVTTPPPWLNTSGSETHSTSRFSNSITGNSNDIVSTSSNATGPIAYYDFEEGSGTTLNDRTGNGYNGTLVNSPTWVNARYGKGLQFNGTNQTVSIPNFGNGTPRSEITLEFWALSNNVNKTNSAINMGSDTPDRFNVHLPWSDGVTYWDFGNVLSSGGKGRATYTSSPQYTGSWAHFAFVSSINGGYMKIYKNGQLVTTTTNPSIFVPNTYSLSLAGYTGANFQGILDEMKIYDYARSQNQIEIDLNGPVTTNPMAAYNFDENTGTTFNDTTGNGLNGTLSNAPTWVTGKYNSAVNFNGTNQYGSIPYNTKLDAYNQFTLEAWINPSSISAGNRAIISKEGSNAGYFLYQSGQNIYTGFGNGTSLVTQTSTTNPIAAAGSWYHVASVWNGTTLVTYVNGLVVQSTTPAGSMANNSTGLFIGQNSANSSYFNGKIDDVKFYNYDLSASQIYSDLNGSSPVSNKYFTDNLLTVGTASAIPSGTSAFYGTSDTAGINGISSYGNMVVNYKDNNATSVNVSSLDSIMQGIAATSTNNVDLTSGSLPAGMSAAGNTVTISLSALSDINTTTSGSNQSSGVLYNLTNTSAKDIIITYNLGDTVALIKNGIMIYAKGVNSIKVQYSAGATSSIGSSITIISDKDITVESNSGTNYFNMGLISLGNINYRCPVGPNCKTLQTGFSFAVGKINLNYVNSDVLTSPTLNISYSPYYLSDYRQLFAPVSPSTSTFVGFDY